MPAVGEHEGAALAVKLRRVVAALPRRDVIGQACDDIAVQIDSTHVERRAAYFKPTGIDERVGVDEIEEVGMQTDGQSRRVVVPVEDVESRRRVAEQVVVHPVVPDQVVGPHPGEHARQLLSFDDAGER
jgi:hypothetical protein